MKEIIKKLLREGLEENKEYSDTILTNKGVSVLIKCINPSENLIGCNAFINGENIADASFRNNDGWYSMNSVTSEPQQNLGIMTAIYDYVESKFNIKINPSKEQSQNAIDFWKARKIEGTEYGVFEIIKPIAYMEMKYYFQARPMHEILSDRVYIMKGSAGNKSISTKNIKVLKTFHLPDEENEMILFLNDLRDNE